MSRIKLPTPIPEWIKLCRKVVAKDLLDGGSSIIRPYNIENEIELDTDETNIGIAEAKYQLSKDLEGESKKLLKILDTDLDPIWIKHKIRVFFLKKYYPSTIHKLTEYGVTFHGNKIFFPADRDLRCECIKALIDHHNSLPLIDRPMTVNFLAENKMDLAADLLALPDFILQNAARTKVKKQSETALEECMNLLNPIKKHLKGIGQFLVGYFSSVPEKAADWGFLILHSIQSIKFRKGNVKNQSVKTLKKLVNGSELKCTGPGPLKLFKGKFASGKFITLSKDQTFTIKYGYGTITLQNLDEKNNTGYEAEFTQ